MLATTAASTRHTPAPPVGIDPIRANQQTFRRVLDALALPGQIQHLSAHPALDVASSGDQPHLIWPATLLLMLVDHEVSLAIVGVNGGDALESVIRRRTRVSDARPQTASTIVCDGDALTPDLLLSLNRGSLHYPDDGATLIVLVDDLTTPDTQRFALTGPGIDGSIETSLPGFGAELLAARDTVEDHYPMGIDLLLLDREGRLLGLPRTTVITSDPTPGKEG